MLTLTACITVGPDYQPPQMALPSAWSGAEQNNNTAIQPADPTSLHQWWQAMNDPLLNELVSEALTTS